MATTLSRPAALRRRRLSVFSLIMQAFAVRRQRRQLGELSDHQLADLGLTRTQAEAESRRRLWDAPHYWIS